MLPESPFFNRLHDVKQLHRYDEQLSEAKTEWRLPYSPNMYL
jgi:hypothetical protein